MTGQDANRRRYYRINNTYPVEIKHPDAPETIISGQSNNLSASGLLVVSQKKFPSQKDVEMEITFPEYEFKKIKDICRNKYGIRIDFETSRIDLKATIVRETSEDGNWVYCLKFKEMDSKTQAFLIRLILEEATKEGL